MNCVNGQAVHGVPHYILDLAYKYSVAGVPYWYTNLSKTLAEAKAEILLHTFVTLGDVHVKTHGGHAG